MGCAESTRCHMQFEHDVPVEMLLHSLQRVVPVIPISKASVNSGVVRVYGRIVKPRVDKHERLLKSFDTLRRGCVCLDVQLIFETSFMASVSVAPHSQALSLSDTSDEDTDSDLENIFSGTPTKIQQACVSDSRPGDGDMNTKGIGTGCSEGEVDDDASTLSGSTVCRTPPSLPHDDSLGLPGNLNEETVEIIEHIPQFDLLNEVILSRTDFWLEQGGQRILVQCKTGRHSLIVDAQRQRKMYGDSRIVGRVRGQNRSHDKRQSNGLSPGGATFVDQRTRALIEECINPMHFPQDLKNRIEHEDECLAKTYFAGASYGYYHSEICVGDVVHIIGRLAEKYDPQSRAFVKVLKPFTGKELLHQINGRFPVVNNFRNEGADHTLIHLLKEDFSSPKLVVSTRDKYGEAWKLPKYVKGEHMDAEGRIILPHIQKSSVHDDTIGESKKETVASPEQPIIIDECMYKASPAPSTKIMPSSD